MPGDSEPMDVRTGKTETKESRGPGENDRGQVQRMVPRQDELSARTLAAMGRIRFVLEEGGHDELVGDLLEVFNELVQLQASHRETAAQNEVLKKRVIRLSLV